MKSIEMAEAKNPLSEYARKMGKEPVILTDGGRPVAALVPIRNADHETVTLSSDPLFLALIERSRTHLKEKGSITGAEMRRRLGAIPESGKKPGRKHVSAEIKER